MRTNIEGTGITMLYFFHFPYIVGMLLYDGKSLFTYKEITIADPASVFDLRIPLPFVLHELNGSLCREQ